MPCVSGYEDSYKTDYAARRENERLTRVMCDIMRAMEHAGVDLAGFGQETQDWWAAHKESDRKREEARNNQEYRETLRRQGLDKLTDEERKALGL